MAYTSPIFPLGPIYNDIDVILFTYSSNEPESLFIFAMADPIFQVTPIGSAAGVPVTGTIPINSAFQYAFNQEYQDNGSFSLSVPYVLNSNVMSRALIFKANISGTNNVSFTGVSGYNLVFNTIPNMNVNVQVSKTPASTFAYTQMTTLPWTNPPALLAGVQYTMSVGNVQANFLRQYGGDVSTGQPTSVSYSKKLCNDCSPGPQLIPDPAIYVGFAPVSYFYGCTDKATPIKSNINTVTFMSLCGIHAAIGKSTDPGYITSCTPDTGTGQIPAAAWTTATDCQAGVVYDYCPAGSKGCSGNCRSGCSTSGQSCQWQVNTTDATKDTFVCAAAAANTPESNVTPPSSPPPSTKLSTGWIIAIIIIGVIVIILIFLIFKSIIKSSKKNKKGDKSGDASDIKVGKLDDAI